MTIREYEGRDRDALIALWEVCELTRPWNNPGLDIDRKMADSPWGLLVCEVDEEIVGSIMVGYDGHRGWINYLAADPRMRRQGIASQLMDAAEQLLLDRDCPKVNLLVRQGNEGAEQFYAARGYARESSSGFGNRLIED